MRANLLRSERRAQIELHTTSELGIDATKKIPGEGFKRPWPPFIRIDETVRKKIDTLFGGTAK